MRAFLSNIFAMEELQITAKKMQAASQDSETCAEIAELIYVSNKDEGFLRRQNGKGFIYLYQSKKLTDKKQLERIKKLVIPPAWKDVWICKLPNGHLQATGFDIKGRKQYRYHRRWNSLRNETKFYRMLEFGKALPKIRKQVSKDLSQPVLNERKVLALLLRIMDQTGIRIGNESYEKQNGSYGLTTLKEDHVTIHRNNTIEFVFTGKKGVEHKISLRNKRLARLVEQCREIPGEELFQYYDSNGDRQHVDSGMLNNYIQEITGENFSAKDFRTWSGTVHALSKLKTFEVPTSATAIKKCIVEALDHVASQLGNTRTVCKKYYVHPVIFRWFEQATLHKYFKNGHTSTVDSHFTTDERVFMKILEQSTSEKVSVQSHS